MIAHIAGVPLEEALPSLIGGAAGLLVVRGWIMLRLRSVRSTKR